MTRARLPADFADRLRDLLSTVQTEKLLMRSSTDKERLERIVALAVRLCGARFGVLLLVSEARGDFEVAAASGAGAAGAVGVHIARTGIGGFAVDDASPVAVADTAAHQSGADELDALFGTDSSSALAVPVVVHRRAIGALELRDSGNARGFAPADIETATELAYLAAAAVEEHRGGGYLFDLFAAALPVALDPARGASADSLRDELARWIDRMRSTPEFSTRMELGAAVHELVTAGDDSAALATSILRAIADRERARASLAEL